MPHALRNQGSPSAVEIQKHLETPAYSIREAESLADGVRMVDTASPDNVLGMSITIGAESGYLP